MGWVINLDLKNRTISLRGKIIFSFLSITVIIILAIALFVTHTFENEFGKYVDESNKVEVNHLIEFDLKNIQKVGTWDVVSIKHVAKDSSEKGIALEIYDLD